MDWLCNIFFSFFSVNVFNYPFLSPISAMIITSGKAFRFPWIRKMVLGQCFIIIIIINALDICSLITAFEEKTMKGLIDMREKLVNLSHIHCQVLVQREKLFLN